MSSRIGLLVLTLVLGGCVTVFPPKNTIAPNAEAGDTTGGRVGLAQGKLLSAYFGLDNKLPLLAGWRVCSGAGGKDGMPVIFDQEIDLASLQAGDFRVTSRSGKVGSMTCVTLMPAADAGELRTVLLVGEFGSAASDPPEWVEVSGHLFSKDGKVDYQGAKIAVTPLAAGPTMVLAERVAVESVPWRRGSWAEGSGCEKGTRQVLRVVWSGGVRRRDGDELGDIERRMFKVLLENGNTVVPYTLGDLDDGDNNHLLCLDVEAKPVRVTFAAGALADPNRDANPQTTVIVP
jgi:hypothetical protein